MLDSSAVSVQIITRIDETFYTAPAQTDATMIFPSVITVAQSRSDGDIDAASGSVRASTGLGANANFAFAYALIASASHSSGSGSSAALALATFEHRFTTTKSSVFSFAVALEGANPVNVLYADVFLTDLSTGQDVAYFAPLTYANFAGIGQIALSPSSYLLYGGFGSESSVVGAGASETATRGTFSAALAETAVPEPETWLLMLAGFGLTGAALRTARKKQHLPMQKPGNLRHLHRIEA